MIRAASYKAIEKHKKGAEAPLITIIYGIYDLVREPF